MNIRKISLEDKINMEERNNILELLERPVSLHGWENFHVSNGLRGDKDIVLEAVKVNGQALGVSFLGATG